MTGFSRFICACPVPWNYRTVPDGYGCPVHGPHVVGTMARRDGMLENGTYMNVQRAPESELERIAHELQRHFNVSYEAALCAARDVMTQNAGAFEPSGAQDVIDALSDLNPVSRETEVKSNT